MKRVVYITGAGGYLGQEIVKRFICNKKYNLFLTFENATDYVVDSQIKDSDVIIHLVTKHPAFGGSHEEMDSVNYKFTKFLLNNKKKKCQFIFLSTDYVFGGEKEQYSTSDMKNPKTAYGITKAKSEDYLLKQGENICVIRTSMLYGSDNKKRNNFINYLIQNLENKNQVELYSDVWCRPTNVFDLVDFIEFLIEDNKTGIFHACGKDYLNRYEIGKRICSAHGYDTRLLLQSKKPMNNHLQSINIIPSIEFEKYNKRNLI